MKLSTKIILPIILISALSILLAGCFGVPSDESPGYTPGTINGIIAAPCCSTSGEPVSEPCCVSPEYWCYYCQNTWKLQDSIEVVLTYGEDEVATTTTNEDGEFTFTNVDPGKNYVVTAYCPDFSDNRPLVKDVALELIEGGSFDTGITDVVSTSLGLVVDFLVTYTEWGPEDISLDEVIANRPNFYAFPKFKKLIFEVQRVLEECGNVDTDEEVQDALCKAAEEISGLDIGCGPGYTDGGEGEGEGEGEDECDGNVAPVITSVELDGTEVSENDTIDVILGNSYTITVNATDTDGILGSLTYSASINGASTASTSSNEVTVTPDAAGTFTVYVNVNDGCAITTWGPVTVEVDCCPYGDPGLIINLAQIVLNSNKGTTTATPTNVTKCMDECVAISSITINLDGLDDIVITDFENDTLLDWEIPTGIDFTKTTDGATVCLEDGASILSPYTIDVSYTDSCDNRAEASLVVTFEDCSCPLLSALSIAIDPEGGTVCDDECATLGKVTISFSDGTSDLEIDLDDASLLWDTTPVGISFDDSTGEVCLTTGDPDTTYTLGVTYEDECGETVYGTVDITFEDCGCQDLSVDAGPDQCIQLACESEVDVDFDGSGSTGTGLTYAWDFDDPNDTTVGTGATPSHTYTAAGTYTVTLTVTDSCSNSDSDEMVLTIHSACGDLPDQLTISYSSDFSINYYLEVQFSDGGGDIVAGNTYNGWCAHKNLQGIPRPPDEMYAYCTLELDDYWPNINWIVNHRSGYSKTEVQNAIWHYIHGMSVTGRALTLVTAADSHDDFCPTIGQNYVVLLTHNEIDTYGIYRCDHEQNILIEVQRVNHCISF